MKKCRTRKGAYFPVATNLFFKRIGKLKYSTIYFRIRRSLPIIIHKVKSNKIKVLVRNKKLKNKKPRQKRFVFNFRRYNKKTGKLLFTHRRRVSSQKNHFKRKLFNTFKCSYVKKNRNKNH